MKLYLLLFTLLMTGFALAEPASLKITLTPIISEGEITSLNVKQHYTGLDGLQPPFFISQTIGPLQNIAKRIHNVSLTDNDSKIGLLVSHQPSTALNISDPIRWLPKRNIHGDAWLRYTVDVSREGNTGPTWELRAEPAGISGAGLTFLVLADDSRKFTVKVNWALLEFPYPAAQTDSLPDTQPVALNRLLKTYFMAGKLTMLPPSNSPFQAASLQSFENIDTKTLLTWSAKTYQKLNALYKTPALQPFTVMFRDNPLIEQSGTAMPQALMVASQSQNSEAQLKQILMHEMVHVFLDGLADESWFQEGLAIYYQDRAAYLLNMLTPEQYAERMNDTLMTYYSNVKKYITMPEAEAAFWTDARARLQPYNRGAMYFLITDGRIREATHGKENLDNLINQFLTMLRSGKPVEQGDWLALLEGVIGDYAQSDFNDMQQGKLLLLSNASQGACFMLNQTQTPVFELGFDIGSLMKTPRIITGLKADSPAAKAGLKNGDEVLSTISLDAQQSKPQSPITLSIERNDGTHIVTFVPTGHKTTSYEWQVDKKQKEKSCF